MAAGHVRGVNAESVWEMWEMRTTKKRCLSFRRFSSAIAHRRIGLARTAAAVATMSLLVAVVVSSAPARRAAYAGQ
jgi:hypothetical protein